MTQNTQYLSRLMSLSWQIQKHRRINRGKALQSAWAIINSYKNKEGEFFANLIFHVNNIKIVASPKNMVAVGADASDTMDDLPF